MADFVCEERPSTRRRAEGLDGFIAEIRQSSRFIPHNPIVDVEEETSLKVLHHVQTEDERDGNGDFVKLVSNKSTKEYTSILTDAVITLIKTLLTGQDIASIEGSLQVSFHRKQSPIQVRLNESYGGGIRGEQQFDVEKDVSISKSSGGHSPLTEMMNWETDDCQYLNHLSPELMNRDDASSVGSSPPRDESVTRNSLDSSPPHHGREPAPVSSSDSGEESGYTTFNDRDDMSDLFGDKSPTIEEQFQGTIKQRYVFGPKVSQDGTYYNRSNEENQLTIDMASPRPNERNQAVDESQLQRENGSLLKDLQDNIPCSSSSDDSENNLPMTSSEDNDSDAPMDLSGDCKIVADSESRSTELQTCEAFSLVPATKKHKCKSCTFDTYDVNDLSKHALREHQVYTCLHCSRVFTAKNNLKRHTRLHTGLKPYKCSQCSSTFARRDDLKGHLLRHDYNKPFRCSICNKGYTDRASVKNHMVKEHGSRLLHVCPQCGESFDREDLFSEHKKTHPELTQYACDICPFIGSNNLMACKHSLLHTRKLFSCKPCNAYFADPFGYTDHIRKHKKNENFTRYVCCFCDTTFPTYDQFVRHEYSHALCKTHACHVCNKQFRSKVMLQDHAQTHEEHAHVISNDEQMPGLLSFEMASNAMDEPTNTVIDMTEEEEIGNQKEEIRAQEEVLDLTMRKPMRDIEPNRCNPIVQSFSNGQENIPRADVPRNGCVSEYSCPCPEDCTQEGCVSGSQLRFDRRTEAYPYVVPRDQITIQGASMNERIEGGNIHRESFLMMNKTHLASNSSFGPGIEKPSHRLNTHRRFMPYNAPSKLIKKFLAARGCPPLIHDSVNKGLRALFSEPKELVIENDNSLQQAIPVSDRAIEEENNARLRGNDMGYSQEKTVVYGLTGRQCRKENPTSPPCIANEEPSLPFTTIKREPMEQCSPPADSFQRENIPDFAPCPNDSSSHKCDICFQTFDSFSQFESHSVVIHKRYMCSFCDKGFTSRPNRDRHVRYHTGERPYKCDLCDHAFHRGDDLKYHRTTRHPEAKPFVCVRCSASFVWKRDLDRHIRHSKCKM